VVALVKAQAFAEDGKQVFRTRSIVALPLAGGHPLFLCHNDRSRLAYVHYGQIQFERQLLESVLGHAGGCSLSAQAGAPTVSQRYQQAVLV
jgi:hypothetical protein